ncbi:MAG: helix-turn-helix domain-containing protein [Gammaproteobacteria bacterium]|nr:MAG: helix-turn-helix domain-containing protein [Gammaproteobacteria bacterium]
MAKRNLGQEILDSIKEIKSGKVGRVHVYIAPDEIKATRERIGVSQSSFAAMLNVSKRTLQEWEQGRRQPTGPARSLLAIAAQKPEVMHELFLS